MERVVPEPASKVKGLFIYLFVNLFAPETAGFVFQIIPRPFHAISLSTGNSTIILPFLL